MGPWRQRQRVPVERSTPAVPKGQRVSESIRAFRSRSNLVWRIVDVSSWICRIRLHNRDKIRAPQTMLISNFIRTTFPHAFDGLVSSGPAYYYTTKWHSKSLMSVKWKLLPIRIEALVIMGYLNKSGGYRDWADNPIKYGWGSTFNSLLLGERCKATPWVCLGFQCR